MMPTNNQDSSLRNSAVYDIIDGRRRFGRERSTALHAQAKRRTYRCASCRPSV